MERIIRDFKVEESIVVRRSPRVVDAGKENQFAPEFERHRSRQRQRVLYGIFVAAS